MAIELITAGCHTVSFDGAGYDAILAAVHRCEAVRPGPLRINAGDWVTLADIAGRVGCSREAVRLWALGRTGPGGFPPPLNPGNDISFYSWAEVATWLRHTGRSVPRREPVLAAMNLALQLRFLAPQLTRMDAVIAGILRRPPRPPRTAANGQLIPRGGRPAATRDRYAAPGHA